MGAIARRLIIVSTPVFWLAAIVLTAVQFTETDRDLSGAIIVATGLGIAGLLAGTVNDRASRDKALLLTALASNRPPRGGDGQRCPGENLPRAA